jgi:predicted nucleic acid-binding protein
VITPRHLVDSSGWIEYFTEGANAEFFAPAIEDPDHRLVASVSLLEVFRWILRVKGENAALQTSALMQQGEVIDLDAALAVRAAKLGVDHRLPLADSIMYATAQAYGATLWTQDTDFQGLPGVRYTPKPPA